MIRVVLYSACAGLLLLDRFGYKCFLLSCSIPSGILLIGRLCWRYESPKYLVAKKKFKEAETLLNEIAKINGMGSGLHFTLSEESLTATKSSSKSSKISGHWVLITLASITFFCQTSAYYGLTLWMSQFLRPWGVSPSLMLLMVGLAEIPGLIITTLCLKFFNSHRGLLMANFGAAAVLSLVIFLVNSSKMFVIAFCALYFSIVSIWTIL